MNIEEFLVYLEKKNAITPGTNTLNSALTDFELAAWQADYPGVSLPEDLLALLRRSNGIGVYQEWVRGQPIYPEGRGALEIYPINEIISAEVAMYGELHFEPLASQWIAFGGGLDSSLYFVFDRETQAFLYLDPAVPNESTEVGPKIDRILDIIVSGCTP